MYRVVLTESATRNDAAAARGGPGALLEYEDREAAAAAATRYSEEGDVPVRLQAPAPNDPRDVDAYLVSIPERLVREPTGSLEAGLSFETSATQYGALGEALVGAHHQDPPVLLAWARRALDLDGEPAVQLDPEIDPIRYRSRETDETVTWLPDAAATVTVDGEVVRRLRCEVKAGSASTERDQRQVMRWTAAHESDLTVLLVRLDLETLPDGYEAQVERIDPEAPGDEWVRGETDRRLGEFG